MVKKVLIGLIVLLILSVTGFSLYVNSGIELPANTEEVVESVLSSGELPELIIGETGNAQNGDINIWYERIRPKDSVKATVLLIMGHSSTAMLWSSNFYQPFINAGYEVIRYDNRGVGASDWMTDWDEKNAYTLEDMAKDGMAVLKAADVDQAHIIGASMGGMIAQRMAISHSDKVQTLTSIMSSGYMMDPEIAPIPKEYMGDFAKLGLKYLLPPSEEGMMKFSIGLQKMLKGNGPYNGNIKKTAQRTLYELRKRNGFNPNVGDQHSLAIETSGSRLEELSSITVPTLVIHGKSDPLVIFAHAEKYAPLIPNAQKLYIDGMGHDIPDLYMGDIHEAIFANFGRVE